MHAGAVTLTVCAWLEHIHVYTICANYCSIQSGAPIGKAVEQKLGLCNCHHVQDNSQGLNNIHWWTSSDGLLQHSITVHGEHPPITCWHKQQTQVCNACWV